MTVSFNLACLIFAAPLLVLIEYVPFGDLVGYLRKSRGLNDTYYKDPDIKPQTNLTSQQLMKFAWQIADGMSYLSSKFVSWTKKETRKQSAVKISLQYILWRRTVSVGLSFDTTNNVNSWIRQSLCINVGYLILDLNCFRFSSYHFRLSIFIYYFKDDLNKAFQVCFV